MQHERAAVMALTFCIGFTTAFIAYGIPTVEAPPTLVTAAPTQTAAVIQADRTAPSAQPESRNVGVTLDDDGLWLQIGDERHLASPSVAVAPEIPEAHVDVHQAVVREDGAFLFFCAETTASQGQCEPRVYDVANFRMYRVESNGQTGTLEPATLDSVWQNDGRLDINGFASVTAQRPWMLE